MGQSRFESLSQELPSVLQSLEDKRRDLKSQGHKAGLWGGILFFIICWSCLCSHLLCLCK